MIITQYNLPIIMFSESSKWTVYKYLDTDMKFTLNMHQILLEQYCLM